MGSMGRMDSEVRQLEQIGDVNQDVLKILATIFTDNICKITGEHVDAGSTEDTSGVGQND